MARLKRDYISGTIGIPVISPLVHTLPQEAFSGSLVWSFRLLIICLVYPEQSHCRQLPASSSLQSADL